MRQVLLVIVWRVSPSPTPPFSHSPVLSPRGRTERPLGRIGERCRGVPDVRSGAERAMVRGVACRFERRGGRRVWCRRVLWADRFREGTEAVPYRRSLVAAVVALAGWSLLGVPCPAEDFASYAQYGPVGPPPAPAPSPAPALSPPATPPFVPPPPPYWKWRKWPINPFYYFNYTLKHASVDSEHGRVWKYVDGQHHGFPYTCSPYLPRAAGASYNFGRWMPTRSYYYAYQPGMPEQPYGYSPEPYYFPPTEPVPPIPANRVFPKGSFTPF